MRTALFFRRYRRFHGGQLKVWDYFNHALAAPGWTARVAFHERSNWDPSNPWFDARELVVEDAAAVDPDLFFVSGKDWRTLEAHPRANAGVPVVNLIQHLRHADEVSLQFRYLSRRAIRICVSDEVRHALEGTGRVVGPILTIPNGIDLDGAANGPVPARDVDLLVAGLKRPALGAELGQALAGADRRVVVLTDRLPRAEFLGWLRRARVTLFLPNETEGFYLPALEGLALGTVVVCPDCVGNRSFLTPGENAFRPDYRRDEIVAATETALRLPADAAERMVAEGGRVAERHSLAGERRAFHRVLADLDRLWAGVDPS